MTSIIYDNIKVGFSFSSNFGNLFFETFQESCQIGYIYQITLN
jgi:hypothetical protein